MSQPAPLLLPPQPPRSGGEGGQALLRHLRQQNLVDDVDHGAAVGEGEVGLQGQRSAAGPRRRAVVLKERRLTDWLPSGGVADGRIGALLQTRGAKVDGPPDLAGVGLDLDLRRPRGGGRAGGQRREARAAVTLTGGVCAGSAA